MKILHTADWHLGKKLEQFSRLEEQREVLAEIVDIADREAVDAVIVAGDLFDSFNPSAEAVELFYSTLKQLAHDGQRPVIAIAGNHDAPERIEAPDPLARSCGIVFCGFPLSVPQPFTLASGLSVLRSAPGFVELKMPRHRRPLRLVLTPYANELRTKKFLGIEDPETELRTILSTHWTKLARQYCNPQGLNILMAHLFFTRQEVIKYTEPEEEKPILFVGGAPPIFASNVPSEFDYVALGHLHRYQEISVDPCPIVYAGSPLAYSFAEAGQQKYVVLIEATHGQKLDYRKIGLTTSKQLHRVKFDDVDEAASWLKRHPENMVEITLVTDTFLKPEEKKKLFSINPRIFLIPELRQAPAEQDNRRTINLNQRIEVLFEQYFQEKNDGQMPNEEIRTLLREVLAS